jgi:thiosulfate/3-mercaptopyruvate sulfurtransferase
VSGSLVEAGWLRERLGDPGLRVVDCRFKLGEPGAGLELWRAGHIPGAAFMDLDRELASEPGERGRHPLPEPRAFEEAARTAGIGPDLLVVAYDEAAEGGAARLWWLLRHFGHDRVAVLDGGLRGWREDGGPLETGAEHPGAERPGAERPGAEQPGVERPAPVRPGSAPAAGRPGSAAATPFAPRPREGDIRSAEELAAPVPAERMLLDARAPERFRGELEPIDPVAGHIPGAVNLPFAELAPAGRFLAPGELRARFEAAGAAPGLELVAYCGSGVSACVLLLAAELAGLEGGRLYPGSWSEWSGRGLPVERH